MLFLAHRKMSSQWLFIRFKGPSDGGPQRSDTWIEESRPLRPTAKGNKPSREGRARSSPCGWELDSRSCRGQLLYNQQGEASQALWPPSGLASLITLKAPRQRACPQLFRWGDQGWGIVTGGGGSSIRQEGVMSP